VDGTGRPTDGPTRALVGAARPPRGVAVSPPLRLIEPVVGLRAAAGRRPQRQDLRFLAAAPWPSPARAVKTPLRTVIVPVTRCSLFRRGRRCPGDSSCFIDGAISSVARRLRAGRGAAIWRSPSARCGPADLACRPRLPGRGGRPVNPFRLRRSRPLSRRRLLVRHAALLRVAGRAGLGLRFDERFGAVETALSPGRAGGGPWPALRPRLLPAGRQLGIDPGRRYGPATQVLRQTHRLNPPEPRLRHPSPSKPFRPPKPVKLVKPAGAESRLVGRLVETGPPALDLVPQPSGALSRCSDAGGGRENRLWPGERRRRAGDLEAGAVPGGVRLALRGALCTPPPHSVPRSSGALYDQTGLLAGEPLDLAGRALPAPCAVFLDQPGTAGVTGT